MKFVNEVRHKQKVFYYFYTTTTSESTGISSVLIFSRLCLVLSASEKLGLRPFVTFDKLVFRGLNATGSPFVLITGEGAFSALADASSSLRRFSFS